ncbi:hypothetical protein ABHN03_16920 [Paenibacillus sp. NRS-1775]|uniref:hypothetical protein n=1 Tax=unclassified Paenibacillus TaxID=185978 RepID=UPI003D2B7769
MGILKLQEESFIEDKNVRNQYIDKIEVLDRVKRVSYLPDNKYLTLRMASEYFEVNIHLIRKVVQRNRQEFNHDGLISLVGSEFDEYKQSLGQKVLELKSISSSLLLNKKCLLRLGMVLQNSSIATEIRNYLIKIESEATRKQKEKVVGVWSDNDIITLNEIMRVEESRGKGKMEAIEAASLVLKRSPGTVYKKHYGIVKKFGSLKNYMVDKNLIILDSNKTHNQNSNNSANETMMEISLKLDRINSNLNISKKSIEEVNSLKLKVKDLECKLAIRDMIVAQKDIELGNNYENVKILKDENEKLKDKIVKIRSFIVGFSEKNNEDFDDLKHKYTIDANGIVSKR